MNIPEIITAIKDVFLAIAGATTAVVAVTGLNNWNRELKGKATFEAAKGLAKATYKLRDEIKICRSPFISSSEFPDSYNLLGLRKTAEQEAKGLAHVYTNRWNTVWSVLQEFDTETLEAEALWGEAIKTKTNELRKSVRELNVAIDAYIADAMSGGDNFSADREFGVRMRRTVASTSTDLENDFNKTLEVAILNIEDELRPHLQRKL